MRKILGFILILLLTLPVISAAKQDGNSSKNSQEKVYAKKGKKQKSTKKRKVRVAHHINKPKEGEILKIEAMVKDVNEQ